MVASARVEGSTEALVKAGVLRGMPPFPLLK